MRYPRTTRVWLRLSRGQMIEARRIARWMSKRWPVAPEASTPDVLKYCLDQFWTTIVAKEETEHDRP